MTIETRVDGSPASVRAASTWLRESLRRALEDAGDDLVSARSRAMSGFEGLAGQAYVDYDKAVLVQVDDHAERVNRAATVFDAYAARLEAVQTRMETIRAAAKAGGLTVSGTLIHSPPAAVAPPAPYGPVTPEQQAAYNRGVDAFDEAAKRVALYNQLAHEVQLEAVTFTDWVDVNVTATAEVFDAPAVDRLLSFVRDNMASFAVGFSTEAGERLLSDIARSLKDQASDLRSAKRSGHPARRALGEAPETPGRIADLLEQSNWVGRGAKLLGPLGVGIDSYSALETDQPGGELIAVGAGGVATGPTIALIAAAPVSVPMLVSVGAGVAVGIGASALANWAWDALPDSATDPVDDFVVDAWDGAQDMASDGWGEVKSWF